MAPKIWVGAAKNKAFATTSRLKNSHRASPARIESGPAKCGPLRRKYAPAYGVAAHTAPISSQELDSMFPSIRTLSFNPLVADLRQSRHEQALDRHGGRDIAKLLQRFQHLAEPRPRDHAGCFKEVPVAEKIVALLDVLRLEAAHGEHNVNGLPAVCGMLHPQGGLRQDPAIGLRPLS